MPRGQVYQYGYDPAGRLQTTTLTNYTGSTSTPQTATSQLLENRVYDPAGRLYTDTNAIGVTRTYAYYDNGLTKQVTDTGSQGTSFIDEQDAYDAAGNLISQVTKNGTLTTNKAYDAENRVTSATVDPSGVNATSAYTYDQDNHVLTSTETDAAGDPKQQWTYTYYTDGDKKTAAQYADAATTLTTSWTYDNRGHALTMVDPNTSTTDYGYNEAGRLAATSKPAITATTPSGSAPRPRTPAVTSPPPPTTSTAASPRSPCPPTPPTAPPRRSWRPPPGTTTRTATSPRSSTAAPTRPTTATTS
jgi:YD repeat-containing protein